VHPNAERVLAALRAAGVDTEVVELAESTRTAAAAAAVLGTTTDRIANSLVFVADGTPVLVLSSGANRVDTTKLAAHLGAQRVERADPETVRTATGYPIGGVPPLAHATELRVVVDETLLAHDTVWAAAGTPHSLFEVAPAELVRATGGFVTDTRQP
jgi:Cys-tRNA(Pro) deacylase